MKVLPPHFLLAREEAMKRAHAYEQKHGVLSATSSNLAVMSNDSMGNPINGEAKNEQLRRAGQYPGPTDGGFYGSEWGTGPRPGGNGRYYENPDRVRVPHPLC